MQEFIQVFWQYLVEIIPALLLGFLISGIVHEFVPSNIVHKYLADKGLKPIFLSTLTGTILPVCCWGSLPIALSFYRKGAKLGPVLAFLVATPATSISALLVTNSLLGFKFALYIFFAVILMGLIIGLIGNNLKAHIKEKAQESCPECHQEHGTCENCKPKEMRQRIKSIFRFAFISMPKDIGLELFIGIILAAVVATVLPIGLWIENNLVGVLGYGFSLVFGLVMYICSTATVPLVDAFMNQGLAVGAGMTLLLVGPVTSYGTILVLKKEFGLKLLIIYIGTISLLSLIFGYLFSLIR